MPTWLTNLYHRLFGYPSVDGALSRFRKELDKLNVVASYHEAEKATHDEAAKLAQEASAFAHNEATRAREIAKRFEAFIGVGA